MVFNLSHLWPFIPNVQLFIVPRPTFLSELRVRSPACGALDISYNHELNAAQENACYLQG